MWERWQKGESLQQIAQLFDRNHSSIQCRVASRNFVTGGLTKDVTRHFVDQSLDGLAPPHPHTLLKRIELAQTVPARVSR